MDETNPLEPTELETVAAEPAAVETENADPTTADETVPATTQETEPDAATEPDEAAPVETTEERVVLPYTGPDAEEGTEATIYEDFSGSETAATEEVTVIEVIETSTSTIVHAQLFGDFLLCGLIVGIFLLRGRYGN